MSKASLETLARTMSIAFLCLAVVAVGKEQVTSAAAVPVKNQAPLVSKKVAISKANAATAIVTKQVTKASKTKAPKSFKARGVWLKSLLYEAGFRGKYLKQAWAVAMKESRGNPIAHNTNRATRDNSYGLFQINMLGYLGADRRELFDIKSNKELLDPLTNAKAAYFMSNGGKDWTSWDIDKNGYNGGVSAKAYRYWLTQYPKG